jgi:thioredoxin reductase (NADPH)
MYDVIIIGSGPAGMSAGLYAKRSGLNTLILEGMYPGGLLNNVSIVDNYIGIKGISGSDLASLMYEHINSIDVKINFEKVLNIEYGDIIKVTTSKNIYETKGIIIAIGRKAKKSGIPNEDKYIGKGISYCALCDGNLYKNKDIVVLGGGNSAFEESVYLSKIVKSIKIIVRSEIKAEKELITEVNNSNNIEIIKGVTCEEILGDEVVGGIRLNNGDIIKCDGVFIYYGYEAETSFLKNLNITDDKGYILVDQTMRTKLKNIYACGDIIKKDLYQIVTAASEGAIAATSARKDIKK